jgi:N-ethylmaleimide reductase
VTEQAQAKPATARLFEPYRLGDIELANRIVMAPLTRNRAGVGNAPTFLMAQYYAQRASAGLIITEATQVSPEGQGYEATPGIHSEAQIAGWKQVTQAVHARGGRIFLQLWHVGRISHVWLQPDGKAPVAPSAIRANAKTFVGGKFVDVSAPRALLLEEIPRLIDAYRQGALNAIEAGFDGVEVHGANGYLIDQFLRDGTNQRDDIYGGSISNRARFLLEVTEAVIGAVGANRVGVRLSPVSPANDINDSDPTSLFSYAVTKLNTLRPVYIELVEGVTGGAHESGAPFDFQSLRQRFQGTYIANNGYSLELAAETIERGATDLIAFGKAFIANPDLVHRLRNGAPLAVPDQATFYGGGARGYIDYPALPAHWS